MEKPKRKRKMVPMYSAEDFFSGKKDAKPVGWMSDPASEEAKRVM